MEEKGDDQEKKEEDLEINMNVSLLNVVPPVAEKCSVSSLKSVGNSSKIIF